MAWYGYLRRLEVAQAEPPLPPPLPPGRLVAVPKRGETLVRELAGPADPGAPTILLLHGWTLCADLNWYAFYAALARHGRVLAMDVRGHGRGIRSEQRFTLEDAADDAVALLAHLGSAFDARTYAASIDVPTAVIVSRRDRLIRAGRQRELAEAIPGAAAFEIDVAHNGWLVQPATVCAAIEAAIEAVGERLSPTGR